MVPCPLRCGAVVHRARISDRGLISVEECPPGKGTLGLSRDLFGGAPLADYCRGTKWREHRCPPLIKLVGNLHDRLTSCGR